MIIPIDLTEVGIIPDGTHKGLVESYERKTAKSGTSEYISWRIVFPQLQGQSLFYMTSLSSGALFNLKRFLDATGVKYTAAGFNPNEAIGKPIMATVVVKNDDFGVRSEIQRVAKV